MTSEWLVWTTFVWSAIFGGSASQVVRYLMDRGEYRRGASRAGAHDLGAYSARGLDAPPHPGL